MSIGSSHPRLRVVSVLLASVTLLAACSSSNKTTGSSTNTATSSTSAASTSTSPEPATPLAVTWMPGFTAPGTPAKYNKVGVIKVGPSRREERLGAGAGDLGRKRLLRTAREMDRVDGRRLAGLGRRASGEPARRPLGAELVQEGKTTTTQLYNYYLGCLKNSSVKKHFQLIPDSTVAFAKQWGLNVAIEDLHRVIDAAKALGRQGGARRPLTRRFGRHGVRDVGLQRAGRRR